MRTYDTYKDSGISWLRQIPSHWESRKFKFTFSERKQKGFPDEPLLAATQSHGVIPKDLYETRTMVATKGLETLKLVEKGDFVISLRSFQGGIEYAYYRGIISPAYTVLTPTAISAKYFKYLGKCQSFIALLKSSVTGIREGQNIDYSKLRDNLLPLPPVNEQDTIAEYLDSATAEIDKAIASQQRMVELLQERKQIIINQAVTQGLNPEAPMKPTNIDWLPQIPSHWDLRRLKYLLKSPLQYGANESPESTDTNLPRYIRITDIKENGKLNDDSFVSLSWEKAKDYLLQKGDILFARSGATVGKTYLFEEQYASCFAGYLIKARCNDGLLPKFLYLFTKSGVYDKWKESIFIKSTIQNIGADKYSNLPVPFPPYDEQKAIVEYIESTISPVNSAISRCEHIIALLTERKQILINDVVTGKIKVT